MVRTYRGLDVNGDFGGRFPWRSRTVTHPDGVRQAYVDEGPRDAPATFLLAHGNPTWGFLYRRFVAALASRYRVVVPDHVGFGRSDKPRDPSYYSLERHVANLERLAEAAQLDRVVPVVQDWGGPIAMGYATRHPDRVAGAVVLNTWAFVRDGGMDPPWWFRLLVLGRGGWRRITRGNIFTEWFVVRGGARRLDPAEADAYRAPHPTPDDRVGVARFPQLIPFASRPDHESWATMDAIERGLPALAEKPALIVWALGDPAFRKVQLERWRRSFRHVDGPHRLANAKHYLQEDAPEAILRHLEPWAARHFPVAASRDRPKG